MIASPRGLAVAKPIGRLTEYVEHRVERQGETLTTAREAGTPTRLVRSNALFCGGLSTLKHARQYDALPIGHGDFADLDHAIEVAREARGQQDG